MTVCSVTATPIKVTVSSVAVIPCPVFDQASINLKFTSNPHIAAVHEGARMMKLRNGFIGIVTALLLVACGAQGTYFEKSPEAVKSALKSATLPYHVLGNSAAGSNVTMPDDQTVVTSLLDKDGNELARFVTTITPDGTGSRVNTEIEGPQGPNSERAKDAMKKHGFAVVLLEKLAAEHVTASIEGRPFDMMFATPGFAKGMAAFNPGVKAQIDQANANAAAMNAASDDSQSSEDDGYASEENEYASEHDEYSSESDDSF